MSGVVVGGVEVEARHLGSPHLLLLLLSLPLLAAAASHHRPPTARYPRRTQQYQRHPHYHYH